MRGGLPSTHLRGFLRPPIPTDPRSGWPAQISALAADQVPASRPSTAAGPSGHQAPTNSSPAFRPSHSPPPPTPAPGLSDDHLSPARPLPFQPSAGRPPPVGPRCLNTFHAPSPLDLGTAFLPQHLTGCHSIISSQTHCCRPAPLGLGVSTFHPARGEGSRNLSDSLPLPQGHYRLPLPIQLGFRWG